MRIISKDEQERITKCKYCESKIAYKMEDVYLVFWDSKVVRCPVCEENVKISIFDKKVKN